MDLEKINTVSYSRFFLFIILIIAIIPTIYFLNLEIYLKYPLQTFLVILVGTLSFLFGTLFNFYVRFKKKSLKVKKRAVFINKSTQILSSSIVLIVAFFVAAPFRLIYGIGIPSVAPEIDYSGILFYVLTYGFQTILISLFLLSDRDKKNINILFVSLMAYGLYESFLGWRIGILEAFILLYICMQASGNKAQQIRLKSSVLFISIFIFTLYLVIQFQSAFRNTDGFSFEDVIYRFWGAQFLDNTISYFIDRGFNIINNDNNFYVLQANDITSSQFNNLIIYGNNYLQQHGNSKTGFGSLYIFFGLIGVSFSFFLLGIYFNFIKNLYIKNGSNFYFLVYIMHFPVLFKIINEQLDAGTLNTIVAIWVLSYTSIAFIGFISKLTFNNKLKPDG